MWDGHTRRFAPGSGAGRAGSSGMLRLMAFHLLTRMLRARPASAVVGATALLALAGVGCQTSPGGEATFATHCSEAAGDATCRSSHPERPYCSTCVVAENHRGCVSSRPAPVCRTGDRPMPGTSDDGADTSNLDESSGSSSSSTTSGDESTSTTGPLACSSADGSLDDDCERDDPTRPYCVGGLCSSCVEAGDHDFCEDKSASTPACDDVTGLCVPCGEAAAQVCTGAKPVCDPGGSCVECVSHGDCPGTACHVDPGDPLFGSCFAASEVIWVDSGNICPGMGTQASPACSLAQAVNGIGAGQSAVVRLAGSGSTYPERVIVDDDVTVAIIGSGTPVISGNPGVSGSSILVDDATLYLHAVRVANNVNSHGISCGNGIVVMEDSEARSNSRYGLYTTAPCDVTVRRSSVFSNGHGGVRQFGGKLHLVNAAVGVNGNQSNGPAINSQHSRIEVLYSTIAGNQATGADSMWCLSSTGWVRNSIVVGEAASSIQLACFSVTFTHSAVDTPSFGGGTNSNVGAWSAGWFANPAVGNFQLTSAGQTIFGGIAMWMQGDPTHDADGTPRPMGMAGFPGYDEP